MLGWFQRLMPHTLLFFPLFERHATTMVCEPLGPGCVDIVAANWRFGIALE
jgi:hypothetical protein